MTSVCLRDLIAEERATIEHLAYSHTAPAQTVQRAQIVWRASRRKSASAIAACVSVDGETVRKRIHCFNRERLEALKNRHCSGCPATYSAEQSNPPP